MPGCAGSFSLRTHIGIAKIDCREAAIVSHGIDEYRLPRRHEHGTPSPMQWAMPSLRQRLRHVGPHER